jgi:phytanoyl-CoA dioxygenase PhyH
VTPVPLLDNRFTRRLGERRKEARLHAEATEEFPGSTEELWEEITRLSAANREHPELDSERRILRLRHLAGLRLLSGNGTLPAFPEPDAARLPVVDGLPEIAAADVTPELLRAGILRDGCLLVRGLVPRDDALRFADLIDRAFDERELHDTGRPHDARYYHEFTPHPAHGEVVVRPWIKQGGGVLAADSPMLCFEMLEMFQAAGVPRLVEAYLGEPAAISVHKTTLRKAEPSVPGAWHQDGAFMGPVRALNLWLSLSRCGDEAPGLDIVPRRLDEIVATQTDEALLDYQVSQSKAEQAAAAGGKSIVRPVFEPGDAVLFDELMLHKTGSEPSMPNPRFAIESWFFGPSAFPAEYAPLAV